MSKSKKKILNKRMIAISLLVITLLSSIWQIVVAVSGSEQWIGAQYASRIETTSSSNSNGIIIRRLQKRSTGERYTVFCAEHGVAFPTRNMGKWKLFYCNRSNFKAGL